MLQHELSLSYFERVPQLYMIEQPFPVTNIADQISRRDIDCEFELLRALTETKKHKLKLRINSVIENKRNRYPQQSIYEETRVKIGYETGDTDNYINANRVELANSKGSNSLLIITQAPIEFTVPHFELMLRDYQIQCVLMLCNFVQANKSKCYDYLQGKVRKEIEHIDNAIQISDVTLSATPNTSAHTYRHVFYYEWPDRGVPQDMAHVHAIVRTALKYERIVVHCSAGLGRSGVIAAIIEITRQLQAGATKISMFGTVRKLREYRYGAVQNNQQYAFIYEYFRKMNPQGG